MRSCWAAGPIAGRVGYSSGIMTRHRSALTRVIAIAMAVAVVAIQGGLPMCASLLVRLSAPCSVHEDQSHASRHLSAIVVSHVDDQAGHAADGLSCVHGACPGAGNAVVRIGNALPGLGPVATGTAPSDLAAPVSFDTPPVSPPPQA
jgi:hypothetical protein